MFNSLSLPLLGDIKFVKVTQDCVGYFGIGNIALRKGDIGMQVSRDEKYDELCVFLNVPTSTFLHVPAVFLAPC